MLRDFFTTDRVPRWQIIVFGLFVLLAGWFQSDYYYNKSLNDGLASAKVLRIEAEALDIKSRSVDFQTYAGAFVSSILDNAKDVDTRRAALVNNILAQDAAVDMSAAIFDEQTTVAVSEYRSALREMRAAVDQTTDVVSMALFWNAASNLLVARNNLLENLQRKIGGPST